jgi:type III pantothenate kinase
MKSSESTLLLLDLGNSRTKGVVAGANGWSATFAVPSRQTDALAATMKERQLAMPPQALACSVVGSSAEQSVLEELAAHGCKLHFWRKGSLPKGFENGYASSTLGPDRLLCALAAWIEVHAKVLVVATFGTATTVDTVVNGRYLGGMIAPGVALMAASLARDTANLPLVEGSGAKVMAVPDNTSDAIFTGIVAAQRGVVQFALDRARGLGHGPARLVITGGASTSLAKHLPSHEVLYDPVLRGLAAVSELAQKEH